jgi:glyoxylase I family protein
VNDVARSVAFYTERLGFQLQLRSGPAFAAVVLGNLRLLLSGPGASGSRPMPDGQKQAPGGWNRVLIDVPDLESRIQVLREAGAPFRNSVESGPGGSQILIEDPDGNPIELLLRYNARVTPRPEEREYTVGPRQLQFGHASPADFVAQVPRGYLGNDVLVEAAPQREASGMGSDPLLLRPTCHVLRDVEDKNGASRAVRMMKRPKG